ncbi:MAG: SEC-C metal-binding domain-containing protein [Candidatus Zixiibacteriota bacterium]
MPALIQKHLTDQIYNVQDRKIVVPGIFPDLPPQFNASVLSRKTQEESVNELIHHAENSYDRREQEVGVDDMRRSEQYVMLWAIDRSWKEHLTAMDHLRQGIGLRAVGQEQPLIVYKREGHALFEALLASIQYDVTRSIYRVGITKKAPPKKEAALVGKRVGRNDPCPCGSGKKYKHCCGK